MMPHVRSGCYPPFLKRAVGPGGASSSTPLKHWYLVFCAYSLLKLSVLSAPLYEKWERQLKTIGVALQWQVRSVIEQLIMACHRLLACGRNPQQVFNLLFT